MHFTENSIPNNEKGFYAGLSFKPAAGLQATMYYDLFVFPWLKYRVDGPSGGRDFLFQFTYQPDKFWRFTTLYKNERKTANSELLNERTHGLVEPLKKRWRIDTDYTISKSFSFNSRMEFVWISLSGTNSRQGFLGTAGFAFRKSGFIRKYFSNYF